MKNLVKIIILWVGLTCLSSTLMAQDYYTVTPLGGSNLTGSAINNSGKVVGADYPNQSAFIWESGGYFYIPDTRWGTDINSLGYVTGASYQGSAVYAYLYTGSQMIFIPPISGTNASGNGINDSGWVTGLTTVDQYNVAKHPFLYKNGDMIDLGTFGGSLSVGKKVNNQGWVVGYSFTTNGTSDDLKLPFIHKGNGLEQLALLSGAEEGEANDINDAGEVCGYNDILATFLEQAVKWDQSGNVISLQQLANQRWSIAYGINNSGDVVGSLHVQDVARFAVLWKDDSLTVLNNLIDPGLGISLMDAYSINDLGEILCSRTVGSTKYYYVITPPPSKKLIVNKTGDESDADLNDDVCDVDLITSGNQCTCRAAIEQANHNTQTDTITFDIPGGGVPTIVPGSSLPEISASVIIDGTTQPETGLVEISGTSAGASANGLTFSASDCVVKGLVINQFDGYGISLNGVQNDTITSCIIGTDPTGMTAKANKTGGIEINNSLNNLVGGINLSERNLISGNGVSGHSGGHGIIIKGNQSTGNRIEGNIIGANIDGDEALSNKAGITIISSQNQIGGISSTPGAPPGNLISGNIAYGITIIGEGSGSGASSNKVLGNLIGTNLSGTVSLSNQLFGVLITENADSNIIGGDVAGSRNIISGNQTTGIMINSELATGNKVMDNFIGVDISGHSTIGNGIQGVLINDSPGNLIGGQITNVRNVITGNGGAQIIINGESAVGNRVSGNYIGTYSDGISVPPDQFVNQPGIYVLFASGNTIGGNFENEGNLISGNKFGVFLEQTENNEVTGNLIGTDYTGTEALGNGDYAGIGLFWSSNNTIGGITQSKRNIISGNKGGVVLVMDNPEKYLNTGSRSLRGNEREYLHETNNMISKFYNDGLQASRIMNMSIPSLQLQELLESAHTNFNYTLRTTGPLRTERNQVIGNYIGTTSDGMDSLGNSYVGIVVGPGANKNIIGGRLAGEGNVVSSNGNGILLLDNVYGCKVQGNVIGLATDAVTPLPNKKVGISLLKVRRNFVGGVQTGAGNLVSHNVWKNLLLLETSYNSVVRNKFNNSETGIDLYYANQDKITNNQIWYNQTGIKNSGSTVFLEGNSVKNNTGSSTGIYMDNSFGKISGNEIEGNSGDGIRCTNQSQPVVHFNNINGNIGFGLENTTSSVTVEATGNWWGDPSGPGGVGPGTGDPVSSGVNYADWLTEPASVVIAAGADTVYYPIGYTDSVMVSFQNWAVPNDILDVTITESYDWLTSPTQGSVQLNENTGGGLVIGFSIPGNVSSGQINTVNIHAVSQSNYNYEATDSIIIYPYQSLLSSILVFPDSATVAMADSQQFTSIGYDQYGVPLDFEPIWSAVIGSIDSSGLYSAPDYITTDTVTVTDPVTQLSSFTVVFIQYPSDVNDGKNSVPTEYALSQNFPNPFNPYTKIRFALPEQGNVKLEVFNILGERVASLLNDAMTVGYHEVILNAESLSSGIYIYRIKVNQFVDVKKMILLK